jgi:uncharacterized membrane protein YgcG
MRRKTSLVAVFLSLTFVCSALAVAPEIKDDAKFFSPDAIKKANKEIHDIARKFKKDFLVETFTTVPGDQAARVKAMTNAEREQFFGNWASDRADAAVVNGVYLMVCKDPAHLQVIIAGNGGDVMDGLFKKKLRDQLLASFRNKKFDEGLLEAVSTVRDRLEKK